MDKPNTILRIVRNSVFVLFALLAFVLLVFYVWIFSFDIDSHRDDIEQYLSKQLEREVKINGGISLKPSFFSPTLSAKDITIANAAWSSNPWFIKIDLLEGSISLFHLLLSEVKIDHVYSQNTKIYLETHVDGKTNWQLREENIDSTENQMLPAILNLESDNIEVFIKSEDRSELNISINRVNASFPKKGPLSFALEYEYEKTSVSLNLKGDSLKTLFTDNHSWPFKGHLSIASLAIDVNGSLKNVNKLYELDLDLQLNTTTTQENNPLAVFGWHYRRADLLDFKLNLKQDVKGMSIDLLANARNMHLSRPGNLQLNDSVLGIEMGELQISASTSGKTISDLIDNSSSKYLLKDTILNYKGNGSKKPEQLIISSLNTNSNPQEKIVTTLTGNYNKLVFDAHINHDRIIDLLWNHETWSYHANINLADSLFVSKGGINDELINGDFQLQGDSIKKSLHYLDIKTPKLGKFKLSGNYKYGDNLFEVSDMMLKAVDSTVTGNIKFTLSETPLFNIALATKRPSLNRILHTFTDYKDTHIDTEKLTIKAHSKGNSLAKLIDQLNLSLSSPLVRVNQANKDGSKQNPITIKDLRIVNEATKSLSALASVSYKQFPSTVTIRTEPLQNLQQNSAPTVALDLRNGKSKLTFNGKILEDKSKNKKAHTLTGSLVGKIDNLAILGKSGSLQLPEYKNIAINAKLKLGNQSFKLSEVNLFSDDLYFSGEIDYNIRSSLFNFDLHPSRFDINHLVEAYSEKTKPSTDTKKEETLEEKMESTAKQEPVTTPIIPDFTIDTALLRQFNINGQLVKLEIFYKKEPVSQIVGKVTLKDGKLQSTLSGRSVHGSKSEIRLNANANTERLNTKFSLDLDTFNYGELFNVLEISRNVKGTFDADIELASSGRTSRELLVNSKGKLEFVTSKGRVPRRILELWGLGLLQVFLKTTWVEGDTTNLHCAVGRFAFVDGFLKSTTLLADTDRVTVAGEIALNLSNEEINGIFKSKPKQATLFRLGTPIQITGTLRNPVSGAAGSGVIRIGKWLIGLSDPYALILLFGDMGAEVKNPCEALLKQPAQIKTQDITE